MKKLNLTGFILLLSVFLFNCKDGNTTLSQEKTEQEQRIVSLNATVTEILTELGINGKLVGRDATSVYPQWVKDSVQNFGPPWTVSAEALFSVKPDLVFASNEDLETEKVKILEKAGIKVIVFDKSNNLNDAKKIMKEVSAYTKDKDYQRLIDEINSDLSKIENFEPKPKVLFVYARGTGLMQVAGKGTPMAEIIELAGGENAANEFEEMKPLTPEGLVKSNPDVILMFDSGINSLGGSDGLFQIPGMKETNAFKNKAIITMDSSLLSSMGPRIGEAAYQLNQFLKPYAK